MRVILHKFGSQQQFGWILTESGIYLTSVIIPDLLALFIHKIMV